MLSEGEHLKIMRVFLTRSGRDLGSLGDLGVDQAKGRHRCPQDVGERAHWEGEAGWLRETCLNPLISGISC